MKTNDIHEISNLYRGCEKIISAKPGHTNLQVWGEEDTKKQISLLVRIKYSEEIKERREKLDCFMQALYHRTFNFPESGITKSLENCWMVVDKTGMTFEALRHFFFKHLGIVNLPVDSKKLLMLHDAIINRCSEGYINYLLNSK